MKQIITSSTLALGLTLSGTLAVATDVTYNPSRLGITGGTQQKLPYDLQFIDELTAHHNDGIRMAQLAVESAQDPMLRSMAQKMITDQQMEVEKMAEWRQEWYPNMGEHVDRSGSLDSSELRTATGQAFDVNFLDAMIEHHPGAIFLGTEASRRGSHSEIRSLGKDTAAKQTKELSDMRKMRDSMM